jgi:hypothetical protein
MTQPIDFEASSVEPEAENIRIPALPVRVCQVFTAPGTLFDHLKRKPVWVSAMAGLVLLGIAQYVLTPDSLRSAAMEGYLPEGANFEIQIGSSGTATGNAQETPEPGSTLEVVGIIIGIGIGTPVIVAFVSFLLLIAFNVLLGGEAKFRQLYSAVTHGFYITTIGEFVVLGLALLGSNETVLSPALLLPDLGDEFWGRLIGMINVFRVWVCFVLGIAISRIYPKRSPVGATIYLLVLYLCQTAIISAFIGLLAGGSGRELRL